MRKHKKNKEEKRKDAKFHREVAFGTVLKEMEKSVNSDYTSFFKTPAYNVRYNIFDHGKPIARKRG